MVKLTNDKQEVCVKDHLRKFPWASLEPVFQGRVGDPTVSENDPRQQIALIQNRGWFRLETRILDAKDDTTS